MSNPTLHHLPLDPVALGRTLASWQQDHPACGVLALLPEAEKARLPLLQHRCREQRVPLVGAIFPALLDGEALRQDGVWLLLLETMPPHALIEGLHGTPDDAASIEADSARLAAAIETLLPAEDTPDNPPLLFLIFDGLLGHIASLLDGLYLQLADAVRYAGVNAGSETFQPMDCLFDSERCLRQGALALLLPPRRVLLEHGYPTPGQVHSATSTVGNRIISIDWRPAFSVYQELIGSRFGVALTPENFYQYACHFPFGILRADGSVVIRIPVALTEDGSLFCVGEVPANAVLVLLQAPSAEQCDCVPRLSRALGRLDGQALLTFYCAGRRMHMGEACNREIAALQQETGAACLAGALTLGEIGTGCDWGYPLFHNATLVCLPWTTA